MIAQSRDLPYPIADMIGGARLMWSLFVGCPYNSHSHRSSSLNVVLCKIDHETRNLLYRANQFAWKGPNMRFNKVDAKSPFYRIEYCSKLLQISSRGFSKSNAFMNFCRTEQFSHEEYRGR